MGRTTPPKGIHTSPSKAGAKNMPEDLPKGDGELIKKIVDLSKVGASNEKAYKGLWTEEALENSIAEFFDYCSEKELKPTRPLLQIWLGISKDQFYEWLGNPKHGYKTYFLKKAMGILESVLQANLDRYPTGSIFLLKTTHGHVEQSKVDVTSGGARLGASAEEISDLISKLGLDKGE